MGNRIDSLPPTTLQPGTVSLLELCKGGLKRASLIAAVAQEGRGSTGWPMSRGSLGKKKRLSLKLKKSGWSATPRSAPRNRQPTLPARLKPSKSPTQMQKSFSTLDPASTGRGHTLSPFWNTLTKENSARLWLPTRTDCVDLSSNLWSGFLQKLGSRL